MTNRRNFIQQSCLIGAGLAAGFATSCSPTQLSRKFVDRNFIDPNKLSRFPKLEISPDHVIKETVGLRPFRKNGFRLEKEQLGSKTIVHNYGHGGSGWSLSWGCAHLVTKLVETTSEREIAVIGSGVSGLSTALMLQQAGCRVTIYTKALPPLVTSSKATGTWSPSYTLVEDELIAPQFEEQWKTAARFSFKSFQNLLGLNDIVTWLDDYLILDNFEDGADFAHTSPLNLNDLLPKPVILSRKDHPFHVDRVVKEKGMVFNIPSYLNKHINDFLSFGGKFVMREFANPDEIAALSEKCIVNCTGLGAKALFNDENMMPVSGQLAFLPPQPEFNYRITTENGYAIPRKDGVVLGGNTIKGNWDETPNPAQTAKVVKALTDIMEKMRI